jgi:hypothetical protein
MQIDDTIRLDYLLKLLNSGGTDGLLRIAPEVCCDWNRGLIDYSLKSNIETVRIGLRAKLSQLGEQKYEVEREMQKIYKELEELN